MGLPHGPRTPQMVQMIEWIARPLSYMESCAQRYGDPFTARFGAFPIIFVSNPQAIQAIFAVDQAHFDAGRANSVLQPILGDHSLILLDGAQHQRQRRLLTPPFHGERMRVYGNLICEIASRVSAQWPEGQPFAMRPFMQQISMQVILQAVFGLDAGQRFDQLEKLLFTMLDSIGSPLSSSLLFFKGLQKNWGSWSPWGRFLHQRHQIDELIYAEIAQRRTEVDPSRTDILNLLLSARDEHDQPMTDIELHDELITLLVAGHETTATALSWALYWICTLPEVHERLVRELDMLAPDVDPSSLLQIPYLNAVCQETLRLYPVAMITFPRVAKLPFQLMDYQIEAGTAIAPCIYLLHRRPDLYPEPERFKPERFLERQYSPFEFLPFGGGNRRCIGMAFALLEMKLVLATILVRFDLTLAEKGPILPARRGVTLAPSTGVHMIARRRPSRSPQPAPKTDRLRSL